MRTVYLRFANSFAISKTRETLIVCRTRSCSTRGSTGRSTSSRNILSSCPGAASLRNLPLWLRLLAIMSYAVTVVQRTVDGRPSTGARLRRLQIAANSSSSIASATPRVHASTARVRQFVATERRDESQARPSTRPCAIDKTRGASRRRRASVGGEVTGVLVTDKHHGRAGTTFTVTRVHLSNDIASHEVGQIARTQHVDPPRDLAQAGR